MIICKSFIHFIPTLIKKFEVFSGFILMQEFLKNQEKMFHLPGLHFQKLTFEKFFAIQFSCELKCALYPNIFFWLQLFCVQTYLAIFLTHLKPCKYLIGLFSAGYELMPLISS